METVPLYSKVTAREGHVTKTHVWDGAREYIVAILISIYES